MITSPFFTDTDACSKLVTKHYVPSWNLFIQNHQQKHEKYLEITNMVGLMC